MTEISVGRVVTQALLECLEWASIIALLNINLINDMIISTNTTETRRTLICSI